MTLGQKWARLRGHMYYIGLCFEKLKNLLVVYRFHIKSYWKCCQIHHQNCLVGWMMLSTDLMNRHSQVSDPGPLGPIVKGTLSVKMSIFHQTQMKWTINIINKINNLIIELHCFQLFLCVRGLGCILCLSCWIRYFVISCDVKQFQKETLSLDGISIELCL